MRRNETKTSIFSKQHFSGSITSIYFDGRKDQQTFFRDQQGTSFTAGFKAEEHVALLQEPNFVFLMHVVTEAGTGKALADQLVDVIR